MELSPRLELSLCRDDATTMEKTPNETLSINRICCLRAGAYRQFFRLGNADRFTGGSN